MAAQREDRSIRRFISREPFAGSKVWRGSVDVATWGVSILVAFVLDREGGIPPDLWPTVWLVMGSLVTLKLLATLVFRLHRQSWVKMTLRDARRLAGAMALVTAVAAVGSMAARPYVDVPLTVPLLDGMLGLLLMLGTRTIARSTTCVGGVRFRTARYAMC